MTSLESIHAVIVGDKTVPGHRMFHLAEGRPSARLIYPFWVLRFDDHITLVDIGFPADIGSARGIDNTVDPSVGLQALGVREADVARVIVSHLHFDHFTSPERFPGAEFIVQRADVDYFAGRGRDHHIASIAHFESVDALAGLRAEGRLIELDGDAVVDSGVRVERIGGHTPGSQVTVVDTRRGPVVFACDASHFYENLDTRTPSAIYHDYDEYQRGFATITASAIGGRWFPGHDPLILECLESVADGVHRLPID